MMLVSLLMPSYSFAQKNNRRKTKKARTEAVSKRKNQESSQMTDKNSYVGKEDNTKYIAVIDDDDSNYIPSEEHNAILDKFLNAYNGNGNTLTADSEIENYINSLSDRQRKSFKASVLERIAPTLENNQYAASLALINLYQSNASKNNKMMPMLYYIKGNIYTTLRDTIGLRQSIDALSQYKEGEDYIEILNKNLTGIRKYKPDLKDLEGYWVSSNFRPFGNYDYSPSTPITKSNLGWGDISSKDCPLPLLMIHNGFNNDSITSVKMGSSEIFKNDEFISQILLPYSSDSIYIAWCNEDLSKNDPFVATLLRTGVSTIASNIVGKLNQKNKHSSTTNILGTLGTTAAEIGINLLVDIFMTPKKTIKFIEANLKFINSHIMKGKLLYREMTIKGDGDVTNNDSKKIDICLYKWEDSTIVFSNREKPIMQECVDEKAFKKNKLTDFAKYIKTTSGHEPLIYNHNIIRQIIYQDYCNLRKQGISIDGLFPENINKPSMGIECVSLTPEIVKNRKIKISEGIIVIGCDIKKNKCLAWYSSKISPAGLYGIKNNDIIIAINGKKVGNAEDAINVLAGLHPLDTVTVDFLRNNKESSICFPLTYYYSDKKSESNYYGFEYDVTYIKKPVGGTKTVAKVSNIVKNSPAAEAKIQKGDMIVEIDGLSLDQLFDVTKCENYLPPTLTDDDLQHELKAENDLLPALTYDDLQQELKTVNHNNYIEWQDQKNIIIQNIFDNHEFSKPLNIKILRNEKELEVSLTPFKLYVL